MKPSVKRLLAIIGLGGMTVSLILAMGWDLFNIERNIMIVSIMLLGMISCTLVFISVGKEKLLE